MPGGRLGRWGSPASLRAGERTPVSRPPWCLFWPPSLVWLAVAAQAVIDTSEYSKAKRCRHFCQDSRPVYVSRNHARNPLCIQVYLVLLFESFSVLWIDCLRRWLLPQLGGCCQYDSCALPDAIIVSHAARLFSAKTSCRVYQRSTMAEKTAPSPY